MRPALPLLVAALLVAAPGAAATASSLEVWTWAGPACLFVVPIVGLCVPGGVEVGWFIRACAASPAVFEWSASDVVGPRDAGAEVLAAGTCAIKYGTGGFALVDCIVAQAVLAPVGEVPLEDAEATCDTF